MKLYNLLNAGFFRLKKTKIFWCIIGITLIIAIFSILNKISTNNQETTGEIDTILLNYINLIGFILAIFISFYVGEEFTNGAIRNKITVGYSRIKIYFTNLIVSIVVGIIVELFYLILVSIIGIPIYGDMKMPTSQFLMFFLNMIMIITTYSCIFTCIALLSNDITLSTVLNLILVLIMIVSSSAISLTANSQEFLTNTILNENGEIEEVQIHNPNYPGIKSIKIAKILLNIIPSGQAIQIVNHSENTNYPILMLYSLCVSSVITILGIYIFNKDNLR